MSILVGQESNKNCSCRYLFQWVKFSNACGIKLSDELYVIVGGHQNEGRVTLINEQGFHKEHLPPLNVPREGHGCSTYNNKDGKVLSFLSKKNFFYYALTRKPNSIVGFDCIWWAE